jgi:endonuclease/exonuclease/phosphatase family metal-dependent hydrolase
LNTVHAQLSVGSLNMHCGRDSEGVPYSVPEAIGSLEADIVVVQENWRSSGTESLARCVAAECGYQYCFELNVLKHTSLYDLGVVADLTADESGAWGLAVLSRRHAVTRPRITLGMAPGDLAERVAQVVDVAIGNESLVRVVNTHLTHHLLHSPRQLYRLVCAVRGDGPPTLIIGDLNMCRPTVYLGHPFRPAVRGRTWPARHPWTQLDHVLLGHGIKVLDGGVSPAVGSDHRPVRVTLHVPI